MSGLRQGGLAAAAPTTIASTAERVSAVTPVTRSTPESVANPKCSMFGISAWVLAIWRTRAINQAIASSSPRSGIRTSPFARPQTTPSRLSSTGTLVTLRDLVDTYLGTGSSSALGFAARAAVARTARSAVGFAWTHRQAGALAALLISEGSSHPSEIHSPAEDNGLRGHEALRGSHARASMKASLGPLVPKHLLVAKRAHLATQSRGRGRLSADDRWRIRASPA